MKSLIKGTGERKGWDTLDYMNIDITLHHNAFPGSKLVKMTAECGMSYKYKTICIVK
jgi:hypothetical protein